MFNHVTLYLHLDKQFSRLIGFPRACVCDLQQVDAGDAPASESSSVAAAIAWIVRPR